jgi:carbonic anhydrase
MDARLDDGAVHRRDFLARAALIGIGAAALLGPAGAVRAASLTKAARDALTPDQIVQLMLDGNARFRSGIRQPRDFLAEQRSSASGQYPAAVALTCIDSRAPLEVICDLGIGDTFNARIAGAVVNDDILGSMEFACAVAGAKLVVVMGHTKCGAVKGAIDDVVLGNLTGLVGKIRPAIRATIYDGDRSAANYGFVDAVAKTNVGIEVQAIRDRSAILRNLEADGKIRIVGSMYDISTGQLALV